MLSITEMSNTLTRDIDISDSKAILTLLRETDAQIFNGFPPYAGMRDRAFIQSFKRAHERLTSLILESQQKGRTFKVAISGAGTSGRIAMLMAAAFNPLYESVVGYPVFDFLIAGGYLALIKAQEGAEDDPIQGVKDLTEWSKDCDSFLYIGITCGFSAHYISGQLFDTVINKKEPAFLIGFNPLERSRAVVPENWDKSFADVVQAVKASPRMVFLNPVVGPEPITGSTRMKGGTATKMIAELLFVTVLVSLSRDMNRPLQDFSDFAKLDDVEAMFHHGLTLYESAKTRIYDRMHVLSPLLDRAGESLNHRGHLYYFGEADAGKWGIVDASECPPTFGADFHDVRGFIEGGWAAFCPLCKDHSGCGDLFDIGLDHFQDRLVPALKDEDTVIVTGSASFFERHARLIQFLDKGHVFRIGIGLKSQSEAGPSQEYDMVLQEDGNHPIGRMLTSMSLKLVYNAITTGAHIFKGKVFGNRMIDLRISNNKLYHRCIHILQELMAVDCAAAEEALLKSIHRIDTVSEKIKTSPVSSHIQAATDRERIVPVALVLSTGRFTYEEARIRVDREHIVRNIIRGLNTHSEDS